MAISCTLWQFVASRIFLFLFVVTENDLGKPLSTHYPMNRNHSLSKNSPVEIEWTGRMLVLLNEVQASRSQSFFFFAGITRLDSGTHQFTVSRNNLRIVTIKTQQTSL